MNAPNADAGSQLDATILAGLHFVNLAASSCNTIVESAWSCDISATTVTGHLHSEHFAMLSGRRPAGAGPSRYL